MEIMTATRETPGQAENWPPGDWFVDAWSEADLTAVLKARLEHCREKY